MRSQLLLRRTRSLFKTYPRPSVSSSRSRVPSKDQALPRTSRVYKRSSSTNVLPDSTDTGAQPVKSDVQPASPDGSDSPPDEPDKVRRRTKASGKDLDPPPPLPSGLDILWTPETEPESSHPNALPPPEVLDEALNNLQITLHPQTQHRATYASPQGPPIEPTLALYCPMEGGDYVVDETIRELARRTNSEVLILDSVQIAAGECGQFGKAAAAISLPRNPLHFPSSPPSSPQLMRRSTAMDEDDDDDSDYSHMSMPSQMTLHVLAPMRSARALFTPAAKGSTTSKAKAFFDELINIPNPSEVSASHRRPRLIFIRDFATLASTSSVWYPPLLSAVRQRRQGPISRPTSPIVNPMTIVFGITPAIAAPTSIASGSSPGGQGMMNMLMSGRSTPVSTSAGRSGRQGWSEDEGSDKAREKRLRRRLKRWEKGDASLEDELPRLSLTSSEEGDERTGSSGRPEIIFLGGANGSAMQPALAPLMGGAGSSSTRAGPSEPDANSRFFRTSVVVPSVRSVTHERECRVSRRRQINQLTMRMGVSTVGGFLGEMTDVPEAFEPPAKADESGNKDGGESSTEAQSEGATLWDEWGRKVEVWSDVLQISDRAVGAVLSSNMRDGTLQSTLEPTPIPWSTVYHAWASHRSGREVRKTWSKESLQKTLRDEDEEDDADSDMVTDEVVEKIKRDPDLDPHEQRLLGCIVDAVSMPTSFEQVHLPPPTIDSVRTIVSLPILHPMAFQHGILKEHSMTGCLLFGPPGTGKTLVVRALAKEAGCRMLAISPSDVMDMYVGEGEKLVKSVFTLARRLAPCVVFIDEIDALFGARSSARETGGAIAHRGVITEFMQEMDGLRSSKDDNVIVIGATNRPFDLDDAVLRRLPRRLLIDLPGEKEREEILKILLRDETLGDDVDLKTLAKRTESFSGSDLKHLCVSAALDAVKEKVTVPWTISPSAASASPSSAFVETALPETETQPAPEAAVDPSSGTIPHAEAASPSAEASLPSPEEYARTLHSHNFAKALKEIVPSSSESLGSLGDLRKWNEEFGEGRKDKRKTQVWGKGRFGFTDRGEKQSEDGRVVATSRINDEDTTIER